MHTEPKEDLEMADEKRTNVATRPRDEVAQATRPVRPLVPPVDIYEDEEKITLLADMPGVTKDGLDVRIDKNVLTIKGTMADIVPEDIKPLYIEFGGKEYLRAFTLGPEVDVTRIEANMSAGVLRLKLPKAEEVKPKRIEVHVV